MKAWNRWFAWMMRWIHPSGVGHYKPLLHQINRLEQRIRAFSDQELAASTDQFKQRLHQGESLDRLLPEAFAVVREASLRCLGMRHYDVQILGGIALHKGRITEMKTGEGKTLVATLPAYLNALTGQGVHIVTVNDYLAQRDAEWMGQIYKFLGLNVGVILEDMGQSEAEETKLRQQAYRADITYATNSALVFDYLRDHLATHLEDQVQRGRHYAIVDEVDLLLIDEVRTPLIISGPSQQDSSLFVKVDKIIRKLRSKLHYTVEWKTRTASLTEAGWQEVESALNVGALHHPDQLPWFHAVYQSVLAHGVYQKDVDYIVQSGEVQLIDEHTGRVSPDKRFSDGLHQALEAKENLPVRPEDRTFARTSYQSYFRLYPKLAGMTGTATQEKHEFENIYGRGVTVVPTHKPMIRKDYTDLTYVTREDKHQALLEVIDTLHAQGRPVLVGTVSVEESEQLAQKLKQHKIRCHILNAKNNSKEAQIIAQAGRLGAVTISTNMAGRGTDILLGGDPEKLAAQRTKPESPGYPKILEETRKQCQDEHNQVVAAGGLHVIGTSLHESERLDAQLRGRSGRQGDPGSSQFMISLDDNIYQHYGENEINALLERYGELPEGSPIPDASVRQQLSRLRQKVALNHASERKETFKYDTVIEEQRRLIYRWRQELLTIQADPEQAHKQVETLVQEALQHLIEEIFAHDVDEDDHPIPVEEQLEQLADALLHLLGHSFYLPETIEYSKESAQDLLKNLLQQAMNLRQQRLTEFGEQTLLSVERQILLETIDQCWIDHLTAIEHLEDRLQLMGYAELDPYVLFRTQVAPMFATMLQELRKRAVSLWFVVILTPIQPIEHEDTPHPGQRKRRRRKA